MPSVTVNPPKTPVTKGSSGIATATLPNVCKMPGPPAPFVPTPLPNIGSSGKDPKGYSKKVKIEGQPVAIQGASFGSRGDIASKGTGGGIVSMNVEGATTFLAPGSFDVKIEGKNVQLLGDQMLNNNGPSGSPANSATMVGVVQPVLAALTTEALEDLAKECNEKLNKQRKSNKPPKGKECTTLGTKKHKCCEKGIDEFKQQNPEADIRSEVPYRSTKAGYKEVPAAMESKARRAANRAFRAAKAAGGATKGVWATAYFRNGGASFKADVLMTDEDGYPRAFDFKFNCSEQGKMSDAQKDKYWKVTRRKAVMIHVDGRG